jgi:LacI family gluconate utilization system Gnt-I transcriptional repressor
MKPLSPPPVSSTLAPQRHITLNEVARIAGVSPMSVSRALNGPDQVSAAIYARVREAVEKTGYVRNMMAGGLASNKSRLVAALVPTIAGPVFQESVESLTTTFEAAGYQVILGQSGYASGEREEALLEALIGRRPAGIVMTGVMRSAKSRRLLAAAGIPVVETWDLTPTPIDMLVGFSHDAVSRCVARFLMGLGRRCPALVSGDDDRAQRRNAAFIRSIAEEGGTSWDVPVELVKAPTTVGGGREATRAILARCPEVDAIFCSSDLLALGVLIEAQAQGISIPGRLAVVGFGDLQFAQDLFPSLTTVRIDGTRIGQEAAGRIIQRAEGLTTSEPIIDVGFELIERESTGRLRR